jgi:hypothetical protein
MGWESGIRDPRRVRVPEKNHHGSRDQKGTLSRNCNTGERIQLKVEKTRIISKCLTLLPVPPVPPG